MVSLSVVVNGAAGSAKTVPLIETFENTGVFKGSL
jgi:hypothetical protein